MKITPQAFTPKDLFSYRTSADQHQTQRTQEEAEKTGEDRKKAQQRPVQKTGISRQGRIDIYV